MNKYSRATTLGNLGEQLVASILSCRLSEDHYDSEKDMIDPDGKFVEVKTQNRYSKLDVFSIRANKPINLNKCMNVDRLIFVEYDYSENVRIWESIDRSNFIDYTVSTGLKMRGWRCSGLKLLHTQTDDVLASEMRSLSSSFEFKRK